MKTSWVNGSQEDQKTVRERLKTARHEIIRQPDGVSSRGPALRHEVARAKEI